MCTSLRHAGQTVQVSHGCTQPLSTATMHISRHGFLRYCAFRSVLTASTIFLFPRRAVSSRLSAIAHTAVLKTANTNFFSCHLTKQMKTKQRYKGSPTIQSHYCRSMRTEALYNPFSIIQLYKNMKANLSNQSLDVLKISPVELKHWLKLKPFVNCMCAYKYPAG